MACTPTPGIAQKRAKPLFPRFQKRTATTPKTYVAMILRRHKCIEATLKNKMSQTYISSSENEATKQRCYKLIEATLRQQYL